MRSEQSAGGTTLDPVRSPHATPNSVGLQMFLQVYVTPGSFEMSHSARSVAQGRTAVPSDPVQLKIDRAARQLSRMGTASIGSKLGDQLQLAGGVVVASCVAASVTSALVLPPHAAMQVRTRIAARRKKGILEDYATVRLGRQRLARAPNGRPVSMA